PKGQSPNQKKPIHKVQTTQKKTTKGTSPTRPRKEKTPDHTTRQKISRGKKHVLISHPKETTRRDSFHLNTAFEKQRRNTKPTITGIHRTTPE
ncbi:unnamed protein product, partial [Brassica rapa subsp. trilocularis]